MPKKEQNIRALTERQKVREKISIWFESKENYYHPILETIVNSIDEINANFEKGKIDVLLHDDCRTVTVSDTGRGIPIEGETDGKSNVELLFLTLFAGGKYEQENPTGGLNGVGNTVICYSSDYMKVKSARTDGNIYEIEFVDGANKVSEVKKIGKNKQSGTTITFRLSEEVYSATTFEAKEVQDIVKRFSACSDKIDFTFTHKGETTKYKYNSIGDYFNDITTSNTCKDIVGRCTYNEDEFVSLEVVMATSSEPIQQSFLNSIYLRNGGSINEGIINGVKLYINRLLRTSKKYSKLTKAVTNDDVKASISFVCKTLSNKCEYTSQAKFSTEKKLYKTLSQKLVMDILTQMESKPTNLDKFVTHICTISKFNQNNDKEKQKLKKKLNENINNIDNRVAKLVDCKEHGKKAQLFIAEGQSALGSLVLARDATYQACYPLRGKILNCLKASYEDIFKNEIITDLVKVLGCGTEYTKDFNIDNLRFGEIIIATDMDVDGLQIQVLALTMIYRLMPKLLELGMVKILRTPLFEIKDLKTGVMHYAKTEEQKEEIVSKLSKYVINRNKGLGEVDANTMHEFIKDTENCDLVECVDLDECREIFRVWMDTQVAERKQLIETNLADYVDLAE